MGLYLFTDVVGIRERVVCDSAADAATAAAAVGATVTGQIVGALPDGSGGFLTDTNGASLLAWLASIGLSVAPLEVAPAPAAPASPAASPATTSASSGS